MENKTPTNPESGVTGNPQTPSSAEAFAQAVNYKAKLESSKSSPGTDPFNDFKLRKEAAEILVNAGVAKGMVQTQSQYDFMYKSYKGNWRMAVEDAQFKGLVKKDTAAQNAVLKNPTPAAFETPDIDLTQMEDDAQAQELAKHSIDFEPEEGKFEILKTKTAQERTNEGKEILLPQEPKAPAITRAAAGEMLMRQMPTINERVEQVETTLDNRKKGTMERLAGLGLTGLSKTLEAWRKTDPKYKIALGLTLAGASVATGGLTSVLQKGLSAASYGSAIYDKVVKEKEAKGLEVKKGRIALKSLGLGILAALATSSLVSLGSDVVENYGGPIKEGVVDYFHTVKDYYSNLFSSPVPEAAVNIPDIDDTPPVISNPTEINGLDLPADYQTTPINGLDLPADHAVNENGFDMSPDTPILPEYTIQPDDNLTSIITKEVLPTIPGAENLSDLQKENMIQNLLKEATQNKDLASYGTINQFTDPNLIQPGKTLDLTEIRQALTQHTFNQFNGETLFEHAQKLAR
jgi:hypothetical protein